MRSLRYPVFVALLVSWLAAIMILPLYDIDVTWVAITGIILPFSLAMMRREDGVFDFKHMSLSAAWYWTNLFILVIPSLFAYNFEMGNHPVRFMISVDCSLFFVPLGILIGHAIVKARKGAVRAYYLKPVEGEAGDYRSFGTIIVLGICVCLGLYHTTQLNSVPLLYMIQNPGAAAKTNLLREDAVKLLQSNLAYVYDVLAKVMFPVLVMVTGIRWIYLKTTWNRLLFIWTLLAAVLYCSMTLERSPVGLAILGLAFAFYMKRKGEFRKEILLVPIALFAFPVVIFLYEFGTTGQFESDIMQAIGVRLFYGPAKVLFYYFDLVPEVVPYQNGATIGKLATLMGVHQSNIANIAGLRIDPTLPKSVSANAPFLGTLYADWGMTGVVLGCMVTGLVIALLQDYLISRPKTLRNLCIYGFVLLKITLLSVSALPYVLGSGGVLIVMIPMFVEEFIGLRRWRKRTRKVAFSRPAIPLRPDRGGISPPRPFPPAQRRDRLSTRNAASQDFIGLSGAGIDS